MLIPAAALLVWLSRSLENEPQKPAETNIPVISVVQSGGMAAAAVAHGNLPKYMVSETGNDHSERERPASSPRAWKEFLDSGGDATYLASLDVEEFSACPDCVFAFRTAVQDQHLDTASVLTVARQLAASNSISTASTVLGLAKAWASQPIGREIEVLAREVIYRFGTSPHGLDVIAQQAATEALTDSEAADLAGLLAANEQHTRFLLTDPSRSEATIELVARLAPISLVCQAANEADNRRAATLRMLVTSKQGLACS